MILCVLLLVCGGCVKESRFGMQELSYRLKKQDAAYAFSLEEATVSNGFYHVYLSAETEHDVLLSCREDENGKLLQILLTGEKEHLPTEFFASFAQALLQEFFGIGTREAQTMADETGLSDPSLYFTDLTRTQTLGRYSLTFFSSPLSVSMVLTYDDATVFTER